jgi:hypothetical protein
MVSSSLEPINIAAAGLIAQFFLLTMIFAVSLVLRSGEPQRAIWEADRPTANPFLGYVAASTLFTIGCLGFTKPLISLWRPLLGISLASVDSSTAMMVTFVGDIILVAKLVSATGGSWVSPFNPMYFVVPVLAIFLREPLPHVLGYSFLVFALFSWTFSREDDPTRMVGGSKRSLAYWLVSSSCFALSTFIGIITRVH